MNTDEEPAKAEAKEEKKAEAPTEVAGEAKEKKADKSKIPFKAEANDNDVVPYVPINGTYDKVFPPAGNISGASKINAHAGSKWNDYKGGNASTAVNASNSTTAANTTAAL